MKLQDFLSKYQDYLGLVLATFVMAGLVFNSSEKIKSKNQDSPR